MIHPIIGNHRENYSLDCGLIVIYLNARIIQLIQFIEILMDNRLPLAFKRPGFESGTTLTYDLFYHFYYLF